MSSFKLVPVGRGFRTKSTLLKNVWLHEDAQVASYRQLIEDRLIVDAVLSHLEPEQTVVILGRQIEKGEYTTLALKSLGFFPFALIRKLDKNPQFVNAEKALVDGHLILCHEKEKVDDPFIQHRPRPAAIGEEYRSHVDPASFSRWHTKRPAYANVNRTSDNIGGSSWDGNLVSWLNSGYTSRIQMAVQSGLITEE